MSNFNIEESAKKVSNLLNQGKTKEAAEEWKELREGKLPIIKETLDRLIISHSNYMMNPFFNYSTQAEGDMFKSLQNIAISNPRMPNSDEMRFLSETQAYDVYSSIIQAKGSYAAINDLNNNKQVILGLRQETNTTEKKGQGVYDDRMAVVWKDSQGNGHVKEFDKFNTEPSAQYDAHFKSDPNIISKSKFDGADVNGDKIKDLGRLRSNTTIEYKFSTSTKFQGDILRPTADAIKNGQDKVNRDTDGNGVFNNQDKNGVQDLNNTFLFHGSGESNTGSAGCQTMPREDFKDFINTLKSSDQKTWQYVLTETRDTFHTEEYINNVKNSMIGLTTIDNVIAFELGMKVEDINKFAKSDELKKDLKDTVENTQVNDNLNNNVHMQR